MSAETKIQFYQKPDGGTIAYRVAPLGTAYHVETPAKVEEILEAARVSRDRLRIHYGDPQTGQPWGDIVCCYVGRSGGRIKVPLEIANSRSTGGGAMLDHCIVKIERKSRGAKGFTAVYEVKAGAE